MSKNKPVGIITRRNGQPFVLFGKYVDGSSPYADSGRTFADMMKADGAPISIFEIEDGPHIEKWAELLDQMEREGVTMMIDAKYN